MQINKKLNLKSKSGFALLFSVMLASFLITLGISIFSISLKEIQIATSVRDSQVSYYAADSARECALYADAKLAAFPTCLDSNCENIYDIDGNAIPVLSNDVRTVNVTCNGISSPLIFRRNGLTYTSDKTLKFFQASKDLDSSPAADISITKQFVQSTSRVVTTIDALGHNTKVIGRRVERGIRQIIN